MNKLVRSLVLVTVSAAALNCGSTTVTSHPIPPHELLRLGAEIQGRRATVLAEDAEFLGHPSNRVNTFRGRVFLESAVVRVVSGAEAQHIPLGQVHEIDANHAALGFVLGVVLGTVTGAGVGWLMAQASPESGGLEYIPMFSLGVVGLLAGGPIGAYTLSGPTWQFTPPTR